VLLMNDDPFPTVFFWWVFTPVIMILVVLGGVVLPPLYRQAPTPTLPPIEVTAPGCEWGGPYPTFHDSLEQWIVICAKGEGP